MILPDVNVLIYAFRPGTAHQGLCRRWLESIVLSEEPFALSEAVLAAVIRITTNPKIFRPVTSLASAFSFCDAVRHQPHARFVAPGPQHWEIFNRLCTDTGTHGSDAADAWFAALAIESDCEWVTMDRDFARFPELRWLQPG